MATMNQSEILFLWDVENSNPNGDMLNENAPRYDDISQRVLVSDVRVKRTIRDDLYFRKEKEIFILEVKDAKGNVQEGKERVKDLVGKESVVQSIKEKCIDVRAFGGVFPVDKETHNLTGALQFKMTKSVHKTSEPRYIEGTGAFASKGSTSENAKKNKTIRKEYDVPYALLSTYGVVSSLNAKKSDFNEGDLKEVLNSLWMGTKNLITRSKIGQVPRFMLKVSYNTDGFFIGELDNKISLSANVASEEEIRSIEDYSLSLEKIEKLLTKYEDKVDSIEYFIDDAFEEKLAIPENWTKLELV